MKCILQTESSECGLACLAMVSNYFGYHTDLPALRRRFLVSQKGVTLTQLMRHAATLHLSSRGIRLELEELTQLRLPAILHWDLNHFVVLKKITRSRRSGLVAHILDPALGERQLDMSAVSNHFTGVALELTPSPTFQRKTKVERVRVRDLTGKMTGIKRAALKIMILAVALETFAIVAPLFSQFVIDEVIVGADRELLQVLVLGFALVLLTQNAISFARSWVLMRWNADLTLQWTSRVVFHLTRLPARYFENRHLGDIVSRLGSVTAIQGTFTNLLVESVLDGLMAVVALTMMFAYSTELTLVVLMCSTLYIFLRWSSFAPLQEAMHERLILSAKEASHLLETIRGIVPLKLFGREVERRARWQNLKQDVINRDVNTQSLMISFKVGGSIISGTQGLVVMYLGAESVMSNSLTIGMLMAFSAYASTFSTRVFALVDIFASVKMLGMHGERLSDIVHEEAEEDLVTARPEEHLAPSLTLKNVRFRYADGEPWILDGISVHIPFGERVVLVGPSGCGKTTLCKIILGLLEPTEGEVLIDGTPIKKLGIANYRHLVGTVMQDDALLAGSIQENISFFDPHPNAERVQMCAHLAAVDHEIQAMPMGYQTLVGDMGSSLSGGQKQRILLARAIYKQPKILALDEATSHLDIANENRVNQALRDLNLTQIMVAHRPQTISAAGRILQMRNGKVWKTDGDTNLQTNTTVEHS